MHPQTRASDPRFDGAGFLRDPAHWDESLAEAIAREDGIGPLTPTHWQIIRELRTSWLAHHTLPALSHVCRRVGQDAFCLEALFHGAREAWRVAGLPDPGEEARAYL